MRLACAQYGAGTDRIFDVSVVGFIIGSNIKYGIQSVGVVAMNGKGLVKVCGHVHFVWRDAESVSGDRCKNLSRVLLAKTIPVIYVRNPRVFFSPSSSR